MGLNLSHTDEYVPTPSEVKLLEALVNPENRKKNITELCKIAGISRPTYYESFKKPEFIKMYNETIMLLVKESMSDIIKATLQYALSNPKNHQDRKMLLEMGKLYFQKQEIDVNGNMVIINGEDKLED